MFQCSVFHLLTPNSFAMIPAAMEQPTEFKSDHKKFNSSVSEWTHSLDHLFIQAKRVRIFGLSIDPRNPLFYYTSTSLLSTPPYSPTPITLLPLSHTPHITPILYTPPTTTPSESQISTPHAPSPLQSGEYCQGTLDIVDTEGVIVGLLPKTQHTPHTPPLPHSRIIYFLLPPFTCLSLHIYTRMNEHKYTHAWMTTNIHTHEWTQNTHAWMKHTYPHAWMNTKIHTHEQTHIYTFTLPPLYIYYTNTHIHFHTPYIYYRAIFGLSP